jgi:hypothetical protein
MLRARGWLAGADRTDRRGLPIHELLAPLPLLAIALLVLNDRVLKGSAAPGWLTGKLSDFAGLFAFPLIVTAAGDLALYAAAKLGAPVDFTLRRWKLATACLATAGLFTVMKLWPAAAHGVARAWSLVAGESHVVADPTDLIALVALVGAWFYGRAAIARSAYGRLELAKRRPLAAPFADAALCGGDPRVVRELDAAVAAWIAGGPAAPVDDALARLRCMVEPSWPKA